MNGRKGCKVTVKGGGGVSHCVDINVMEEMGRYLMLSALYKEAMMQCTVQLTMDISSEKDEL